MRNGFALPPILGRTDPCFRHSLRYYLLCGERGEARASGGRDPSTTKPNPTRFLKCTTHNHISIVFVVTRTVSITLTKYHMVNKTANGANNTEITKEELEKVLSYDRDAGHFIRLTTRGKYKAGETAGSVHKYLGYIEITVKGRKYYAHRLAHLAVTGEWPAQTMDHINGYRADNRWVNLRPATVAQNQRNKPGNGSSGIKNVVIYDTKKFGTRYRAMVRRDGELHSAVFADLDHAMERRDAWLREFAGEFANTRHIND